MINILFEAAPIDPATGVPMTVRFASATATGAGTQLNNLQWEPAILSAPETAVTFFAQGVVQAVSVDCGDITLSLTPANASLSQLVWDGATGRVFTGQHGADFSTYQKVFEGTLGAQSREGSTLKIPLYGVDFRLSEAPLLTGQYAGTGGVEGTVSLKGKDKPKAYGQCRYVTPVKIDPAYVIYQVHDGACSDISAVYESALSLGAATATASSYADLCNLTLQPGQWAKAPSVGMFRLASEPTGKLTADVSGDVAAGSTLASITSAILICAGVSAGDLDTSSINATGSMAWNLYVDSQAQVGDLIKGAWASAYAYIFADELGRISAGSWLANGATLKAGGDGADYQIIPASLKQEEAFPPVYSVTVQAERCWTEHSESDISPAIAELQESQAATDAIARDAQSRATQAQSDIAVEKARTDAIVADGVLDRSEKAGEKQRYAAIVAAKPALLSQASSYAVSSSAYQSAFDALTSYLNSLSPAWNDLTADTAIDRATYDARWTAEYQARAALTQAIADATAKLAVYTSVTGTPTQLSQINSTEGSKLSGVANNATKNTPTYSSTAPASPTDGDIWADTSQTPPVFRLRTGGAWQVVANYVTNTNQVTDGANLGKTAIITQVMGAPLAKLFANNLLELKTWANGADYTANTELDPSGAYYRVMPYQVNHPTANAIVNDIGPSGTIEPIMATNGTGTLADGGGVFQFGPSEGFDPKKTYRFSIWMRVPSASVQNSVNFYIGLGNSNSAVSTNWNNLGVYRQYDGAGSTNAYFVGSNTSSASGGIFPDKWVLFVGYVYGCDYTGAPIAKTGFYDPATGARVGTPAMTEWRWNPSATRGAFRFFYYTTATGKLGDWARPAVQEISANSALDINQMIATPGASVGSNLLDAGALLYRGDIITNIGTAANLYGQAATATNSDYSAITGASRPEPGATKADNFVINGKLDDPASDMFLISGNVSRVTAPDTTYPASTALRFTSPNPMVFLNRAAATAAINTTGVFAVSPGDTYYASLFMLTSDLSTASYMQFYMYSYDANLKYIGVSQINYFNNTVAGSFENITKQYIVPQTINGSAVAYLKLAIRRSGTASNYVDVCQIRFAASQAGSTVGADVAANVTNAGVPLSPNQLITAQGTAANFAGQGAFATLSSIDLTDSKITNKSLANLDSTASSKLGGIAAGATVGADWNANLANVPPAVAPLRSGDNRYLRADNIVYDVGDSFGGQYQNLAALRPLEAGANVTESRTAANIAGQGAFATLSSIDLTDSKIANKSLANLDSTASSKLGGIAAGATVGADWSANLSNRPAFATDLSQGALQANYIVASGTDRRSLLAFFPATGGADRTSDATAANIKNQAATATNSDFAAITGSTKPANNATVGADWSSNLANVPIALAPLRSGDNR